MATRLQIYNKALLDLKETVISQADLKAENKKRNVQILDAYFQEAIQKASTDGDWTFLDEEIQLVTETRTVTREQFVEEYSTDVPLVYSSGRLYTVKAASIYGRMNESLLTEINSFTRDGVEYVTYRKVVDEGPRGDYSHVFTMQDDVYKITNVFPEGGEYRRIGNKLYTTFMPVMILGQVGETIEDTLNDAWPALFCDLIAHTLAFLAATAITNNDQKVLQMVIRKHDDALLQLMQSDAAGGVRRIIQ